MVIDFHTHIFPDTIAHKTIAALSERGKIPPYSDGTTEGLLKSMEEAGIDICVTLPVLTSPSQFESVNRFAKDINERFEKSKKRLISFAGIHPDCEDIEGKMKSIRDDGFLGVKIHPDYQRTFIDDERYVKILKSAKDNDLIVITHAGVDVGFPGEPIKCTPERALKLIERIPYSKFVLAHAGGNAMYKDVLDKLCGCDVYFDTAYVLRFIGEETFKEMLAKHGADRILFASDSPWSGQKQDLEIINSYGLDTETKNKILYGNAEKLLRNIKI